MITILDILACTDTDLGRLVKLLVQTHKLADLKQQAQSLGLELPNPAIFYRESCEFMARAIIAVNTLGE